MMHGHGEWDTTAPPVRAVMADDGAVTVRAAARVACRAAHPMSGRQEAVTGVQIR